MNQTREEIEYEKGVRTLDILRAKKLLSEEGIDTSKISRKKLDEIARLYSQDRYVRQKYQDIINKAQEDLSVTIHKAREDLDEETPKISTKIEDITKSIKIEQGIIKPATEAVPEQEEVAAKEETKEEAADTPGA